MANVIIGCPVDDELTRRANDMMQRLRTTPHAVPRDEVVKLVGDLTQASFEYHFVRPLEDLGVGFATRKGVQVSLAGAAKVIRSAMQKIVKTLDEDDYAKLAHFIDDAYFEH